MARDFEWDERKATSNLAAHGVTFREATAVFVDREVAEIDASREGDGETRAKAIGMIAGRLFTVVFTERGAVTRLISARRANRNEERAYADRPLQTRSE